mmetsp:Transcript_54941/g.98721  ORF Transcript_54941/g.98721 Transcript_54941/m.98721 type:complete len:611 (-) Transcript_54941:70-1902(-)
MKNGNDATFEDTMSEPGAPKRRCTDFICLFAFLLSFGCLGYVIQYAYLNGNIQRLHHPVDAAGRYCGLGPDAPTEKYLYLCPGAGLPLALSRSVCTSECPGASNPISCPGSTASWGYETRKVAGKYCMPKDPFVRKSAVEALSSRPVFRAMLLFDQINQARSAIALAAGFAATLGIVYLLILRMGARVLLLICASSLTLLLVGSGLYFIGYYDQRDEIAEKGEFRPGEFNVEVPKNMTVAAVREVPGNEIIGTILFMAGVFIMLLFCCFGKSLEQATKTVEASCDCIMHMPSILFEPILHIVVKALVFGGMIYGFGLLLSTGTILSKYEEGVSFRTMEYSDLQVRMIIFYMLMFCWVAELANSVSQFAISYVVQAWYFTPLDASIPSVRVTGLFKGYFVGVVYHLGTLAFGSLLIGLLRIPQLTLDFFAAQSRRSGSIMGEAIACCCCLCSCCMTNFIGFLNKNAYMDVAIYSTSFCAAATRSARILAIEFATVGALHGMCLIFQIIGVAFITGVGGYVSWFVLTYSDMFSNPKSEQYVQDPQIIAGVACVVCALVAMPFTIVFDHVADTMLYCFAIEKRRQRQGGSSHREYNGWRNPLPRFKKLVSETD